MNEHSRVRIVVMVITLLLTLCAFAALATQGPVPMTSAEVHLASDTSSELRVVVSIAARRLWVRGPAGDTLRTMPVAVGSGRRLSAAGKTWRFATPVGIRRVVSTETDPVWMRPDWAYAELARQRGVRLDSVSTRRPRAIGDGDSLVVRGGVIGVARGARFEAWPVDQDIIIGRVLYMPPLGSPYRAVRGVLGAYRLNLGASIGFHGTLDKESIGRAVTHGCMRVHDDDLEWLYRTTPVGTPVFIY